MLPTGTERQSGPKRKRAQYVVALSLWCLRDALQLVGLKRAAWHVQGVGDQLMITSWRRDRVRESGDR